MYSSGSSSGVADSVDAMVAVDTTVDGTSLTDRQQEFASRVGARSALSGSNGSVFLYRQDTSCAVRWQISPAGHPVTVDFLI
jgi:hypothetical protein